MKYKDCGCCRKGWFKSKPNDYVCIGVKEAFVIKDINHACTEYPEPNSNYVPPASKNDNFDIDVVMAQHNYETYQNDLKQRNKDLIKKWNKKIVEASSNGEKFFMTNQFITDENKDKILFMLDEYNCVVDLPVGTTMEYFQKHFEEKGFKVVKIEYPNNNICCLKIIWISSSNK